MNVYENVISPALGWLALGDRERAKAIVIRSLQTLQYVPFALRLLAWHFEARENPHPVTIADILFPNRVGLAAGLDKDGHALLGLQALGFGFLEAGTITPQPQLGNPRPRIMLLPEQKSIWNAMGFNNGGAVAVKKRILKIRRRLRIPLGISIGKQATTPAEEAERDYLELAVAFSEVADYLAVNVSSPNTKGLRDLQARASLERLLRLLKLKVGTPIFVKIAPDLTEEQRMDTLEAIVHGGADGIINGNTTTKPPAGFRPTRLFYDADSNLRGGYSGKPQFERTLAATKHIRKHTDLPLITVGGIWGRAKAATLYDAGADLCQVYTGLVYRGPQLVTECRRAR